MIALQSPVHAKMYRWVGKDGRIFYSDRIPPPVNPGWSVMC
ncbi:hypothetical protein BMR06_03530 [Methylococcaceae bacterium HT5]|nr:hypothetical protein BMR06_03530 [Methylococcaceae bacterium HT5]